MAKQRGLFFGHYETKHSEVKLKTYSKRAFVFAGQGSMAPREIRLVVGSNKQVKARLKEVDRILSKFGQESTSVLFEDTPASNFLVKNLAGFAIQCGISESLILQNLRPAVVTGHSFGEFAALVTAGVVSFSDMLEIILVRELVSPGFKTLGVMVAVKNSETVQKIASEIKGVFLANKNSPEQVVYSCELGVKDAFKKKLTEAKISHVELNVPHPYHSPIMKGTTDAFLRNVNFDKYEFTPPLIPLFSSVDHNLLTAQNFSREKIVNIISHQLLERVDFEHQILSSLSLAQNFVEIGLSSSLTGFIQKTLAGGHFKTRHCFEFLDLKTDFDEESVVVTNNKVISALNKVLVFITGYELTKIELEDRLQEDLGIDSLKKAEIIFKVLDDIGASNLTSDQNINISNLVTVNDVLTYFDRQDRLLADQSEAQVSHDYGPDYYEYKTKVSRWEPLKLSELDRALARKPKVLNVVYQEASQAPLPEELILFFSEATKEPKLVNFEIRAPFRINDRVHRSTSEILFDWYREFFQYFRRFNIPRPWCDGNINFNLVYKSADASFAETLITFLKSWSSEQGMLSFRAIEVPDDFNVSSETEELSLQLVDQLHLRIKLTPQERFVRVFKEKSLVREREELSFKNVVFLAGHRGVGWETLKKVAHSVSGKILILGRTEPDAPELVTRFSTSSFKEKIIYQQVDLLNADHFKKVLTSFITEHGKLDLLVNSVGYASSTSLKDTSDQDYLLECETKLRIALSALRLSEECQIPELVYFSSVVAQYSNAGQASYCLANSFVDALSSHFSHLKVTAWPPWENVGLSGSAHAEKFISLSGLHYMPAEVGQEFFYDFLRSRKVDQSVCVYNRASELRYESTWIDRKLYRQFFTINQAPSISRHLDISGFNLKDLPYLKDHLLAGQPVVAASNMIALFLTVGQMVLRALPRVEDFEGFNFMFVQKHQSVFNLESNRDDHLRPSKVDMSIKSTMVHSEGKVILGPPPEPMKKNRPRYEWIIESSRVHNPVIQVVGTFNFASILWCDPETKDVVIEFSKNSLHDSTDLPLYDLTYQVIEICHQALGTAANWRTNRVAVPRSLGRFQWFRETRWTEKLYVVQKLQRIEADSVLGDAWVLNQDDEVVAEIKDMKFSFIKDFDAGICPVRASL
jgi:[acyl-carrier-protein] S-malonyltransferase